MEYTTESIEKSIIIEGSKYYYDLIVSGYSRDDEDNNYSDFTGVSCVINNLCKGTKEIYDLDIENEIKFQLENELEDILRENGQC